MTRQDEARQLLAKLDELARDETLSEEDATVLVAGLAGILPRMQQNPTWARVAFNSSWIVSATGT